jgi:hypothetical protein
VSPADGLAAVRRELRTAITAVLGPGRHDRRLRLRLPRSAGIPQCLPTVFIHTGLLSAFSQLRQVRK